MKRIVILIFYLFVSQSQSQKSNYLAWNKERPLLWSDFKGVYEDTGTLAQAKTTYKIEIEPLEVLVDESDNIQNYLDMDVETRFYPEKSWVQESSDLVVITDNLLQHEQLHFDIAELYARKMRYEFSKLKKAKIRDFDAYQNVWTRLWKECRAVQKKFDFETNHGIEDAESIAWTVRIKEQLKTYEPFSKK